MEKNKTSDFFDNSPCTIHWTLEWNRQGAKLRLIFNPFSSVTWIEPAFWRLETYWSHNPPSALRAWKRIGSRKTLRIESHMWNRLGNRSRDSRSFDDSPDRSSSADRRKKKCSSLWSFDPAEGLSTPWEQILGGVWCPWFLKELRFYSVKKRNELNVNLVRW